MLGEAFSLTGGKFSVYWTSFGLFLCVRRENFWAKLVKNTVLSTSIRTANGKFHNSRKFLGIFVEHSEKLMKITWKFGFARKTIKQWKIYLENLKNLGKFSENQEKLLEKKLENSRFNLKNPEIFWEILVSWKIRKIFRKAWKFFENQRTISLLGKTWIFLWKTRKIKKIQENLF